MDVTKGEVAYDDPPSDGIRIDSESFINFVVRHLDEALYLRMLWLEIKTFYEHYYIIESSKFILTP